MSYRTIDVSDRQAMPVADQAAPMLDWIPVAKLLVDARYQRDLAPANWRHILAIASDFRWSRFAPVLVAPVENGLFAIIDGQHRAHAAALCGFKTVPAMSVHMTLKEQASAFSFVNGQVKPVGRFDKYKAALAAGEAWAERCDRLVDAAGCRLRTGNGSSKTKKPGDVYAIGLIQSLVLKGEAAVITPGLKALRASETGSPQDVYLYGDGALRVWLTVLAQNPAFLRLDLAAFLKAVNLVRLIDKVKSAAEFAKDRTPLATLAVAALTERLRAFAAKKAG